MFAPVAARWVSIFDGGNKRQRRRHQRCGVIMATKLLNRSKNISRRGAAGGIIALAQAGHAQRRRQKASAPGAMAAMKTGTNRKWLSMWVRRSKIKHRQIKNVDKAINVTLRVSVIGLLPLSSFLTIRGCTATRHLLNLYLGAGCASFRDNVDRWRLVVDAARLARLALRALFAALCAHARQRIGKRVASSWRTRHRRAVLRAWALGISGGAKITCANIVAPRKRGMAAA